MFFLQLRTNERDTQGSLRQFVLFFRVSSRTLDMKVLGRRTHTRQHLQPVRS